MEDRMKDELQIPRLRSVCRAQGVNDSAYGPRPGMTQLR
jgi:hypothetical protein